MRREHDNGVFRAGKQEAKPLSFKAIEMMKPGDKNKADIVRNRGLRVSCGTTGVKSFFNRYMSPVTGKLAQVKIGNFPQTSLAAARLKLNELKLLRQEGWCPASELKQEKQLRAIEAEQVKVPELTVQGLVELYLTERIEDRKTKDGKIIPGARKKKGQDEVRRTLYADAVDKLGNRNAAEITRNDVITLINGIVARGAKVQAGNVLRELSLAYEFAIGLGRFDASFANPALLVKSSLHQTRIKLTNNRGTRVLFEAELKKFLLWLPGSAFSPTIKNVLRLTLWTGCRTGEVCNMAWKDVDLDKGTIHLKETKTGVERYMAIAPKFYLLRELRVFMRQSAYSKSYILRYPEEALAETIGLLRARGMSAEYIIQGFKFPLGNTYEITFSLLRQEAAGILLGPVSVGGIMYSVWYGAQQ